MLSPRWRKALRDLGSDRARAFLTVLAMTVGVFGIGMVVNAYAILMREMDRNYQRTTPASAVLWTGPVTADLVQAVRDRPDIADAEARRRVVGRVLVGPDEWRDLWLYVIDDFTNIRIDTFTPERGRWPPATGEILLERVALSVAKAGIGDALTVRLTGSPPKELRLAGTVHAPGLAPAWMEGLAYGFITRETLAMLGGTPYMDEIRIVVGRNALDKNHIHSVTHRLQDWLTRNGYQVYRLEIPEPGKHPHASQMATLLFLLEAFGLLALVLSGVLVANMISALLARQIRQIGVMKAVGAGTPQIAGLYLSMVTILGAIALILGIPAGILAGRAYATFAAGMLNFEITSEAIPFPAFALQIGVGLFVPLLAAFFPVYRGSRTTVRQAIGDYGAGRGSFGATFFDRWLARLRGLSRPFLMSLRNTFRRRSRLFLTVGTLATGGACFIAAMNVSASMDSTVAAKFSAARYDIQVRFNRPYPAGDIERTIRGVPGVARVESWGGARVSRIYSDGTEGNSFNLIAPPAGTRLITALPLIEGRWLRTGDMNALVVNEVLLSKEPEIKVGNEIRLKIGARKTAWRVVGIVREIMAPPAAYTNNEALTAVTGQTDYAQNAVVVGEDRGVASVAGVARLLERSLAAAGFDVGTTTKLADLRKSIEDHLMILAAFLVMMSALVVMVGGLGLASTVSLNVLERTREIGVLRAVGASDRDVLRLIVAEGIVIGALSWFIALALSWPVSAWISWNFGMIFFEAPLEFAVSPAGFGIWLGLVIVFAAAASFYPARGAARLTVRKTLAYE